MTIVHAVAGIVFFVIVVGLGGYVAARYLDKKYGTEDR